MTQAETIQFEAHPDWVLKCKLFTHVTNAADLVTHITSGNLPMKTSLINATLVPDLLPLYVAGDKALRSLQSDKGLSTRTLGSELLYNLSGSRHIRDALIKFGVKDSTSILLAWFEGGKEGDEENGDVSDLIKGSVADLGDLHLGLDQSQVVDWYKIHDKELTNASLTDCVVFRIGAKDFLDKKQK